MNMIVGSIYGLVIALCIVSLWFLTKLMVAMMMLLMMMMMMMMIMTIVIFYGDDDSDSDKDDYLFWAFEHEEGVDLRVEGVEIVADPQLHSKGNGREKEGRVITQYKAEKDSHKFK